MDSKTALDKVKEIELEAARSLEEAKKEFQKILADAKLESARLIRESEQQAKLDAQKLKAKIEQETVSDISAIEAQSRLEREALIKRANNNLDKAVAFMKDKITKDAPHGNK